MRMIEWAGGRIGEMDALEAMFVARREVFVDILGWDVPVIAGAYELDQFDDPHARYLILLDDDGRHRASARLLPTIRPHILDTLYPDLCEEAVPRGPDVLEVKRFCLDRHQTAAERRQARNLLVTGLARSALEHGIRRYTGVADVPWFNQIRTFGWQCRSLGASRRHGRHMLNALCIDIDDDVMADLASTGIYHPSEADRVGTVAAVAA